MTAFQSFSEFESLIPTENGCLGALVTWVPSFPLCAHTFKVWQILAAFSLSTQSPTPVTEWARFWRSFEGTALISLTRSVIPVGLGASSSHSWSSFRSSACGIQFLCALPQSDPFCKLVQISRNPRNPRNNWQFRDLVSDGSRT